MSDRGRSRRTARSTKATPPQAAPDTEVEPTADAESDTTNTEPTEAEGVAEETVSLGKKDDPDADAEAADGAGDDTADEDGDPADASDAAAGDPDAAADGDDPDATADDDEPDKSDKSDKSAKAKNAKTVAPATKAEKRAAARIAAAKVARRRRAGQAIAGTMIVLLVVGGAFAGVWYFGDRAEKNRIKCKPVGDANAFPPLLGGMDKGLATEPKITASTEEITSLKTKVLIKGDCKAVKAGQTVTVNYVGATMKDGKVFDASWPRKKTIEIPVGQKQLRKQPQVIEGWDEGLVGLKVGSRVQLDIPGSKAYGDDAPEGYPKGTLRFIVDILDAKDADDSGGLPAGFGG
ncbi:hypothetical protein GCM10009827_032600 [Dactylosporangium maewongense]|uniref:peptidylprolyl isomerase n=1 Tax=Dactylosporangium maewongense TaxID=634393 RepID=A0ABN2AAU5_9ACTN